MGGSRDKGAVGVNDGSWADLTAGGDGDGGVRAVDEVDDGLRVIRVARVTSCSGSPRR